MMKRRRQLLLLFTTISLAIAPLLALSTTPKALKPFCEAKIDYSAANEYVQAHYGKHATREPYFGRSVEIEPIYDARQGVYNDQNECLKPATIDSCGFTLINKPSRVADWSALSQIRETFLPEVKEALQHVYSDSKICHMVFWNPMLRGQDLKQTRPGDGFTTPTASFAASPHIDMDIGAYDNPNDLITLFEKNRVDTSPLPRQALVNAITEGKRFAILNAWRNIAEMPIVSSPLALFSVRYDEQRAFPEAAPNMDLSRWYVFSNMIREELLLFCQYDRDVTRSSDVWHCGLTTTGDPNGPSRSSFDVRCFIVFDEIVLKMNDRFSENRLSSILTQEESGCFCEEQAARFL